MVERSVSAVRLSATWPSLNESTTNSEDEMFDVQVAARERFRKTALSPSARCPTTDLLAGERQRIGSDLHQLQSAIESPGARICASRPNSAALFTNPSAGRSTSTKTGGL